MKPICSKEDKSNIYFDIKDEYSHLPFEVKEKFQFYLSGHHLNENMFTKDGDLNPDYNSFKKTGLIAQILEDHLDETYNINGDVYNKYRPNAYKELTKTIDCHNKNLGCSIHECPNCHDLIIVGFTCKSRTCSSCGYKYKLERVESIINTAYNCQHRQIVFTIPKEFRKIFFTNFIVAINILFEAVNETIYSILNESYKKKNGTKKIKKYHKSILKYIPGFFSFLHTFGRDMKFNPHIHVLIAEMKMTKEGLKKTWDYFNYDALSKRFQIILLKKLYKANLIDKETINKQYSIHKNGYYVYAEKKKFKSFKDGIEYVTRYCSRLPISENRIKSYDGENVTFFYNAHEDESYHEVTVSAIEFITMLIRHVIPSQFKTIRYYGFYRKKLPQLPGTIGLIVSPEKKAAKKNFLKYPILVQRFFNRNPYKCPSCNSDTEFIIMIT